MKDSEFIQLLNLYLDHEISPADAARLEAEVQNHPERRKLYQDYCRMQKACRILAADFQTEPVTGATPAEKKVVSFNREMAAAANARRARANNFYTIGAITAAAACVAIIFVGRSRQAQADAAAIAANHAAQSAEVAVSAPATTPVPAVAVAHVASATPASGPRSLGGIASATMVADPLLLTGNTQADAVLAAAIEQANAQFAWMQNVQLPPIQTSVPLSDLRFEAKPATLRPEGRTLGNRPSANQANVEMAAFQFMK